MIRRFAFACLSASGLLAISASQLSAQDGDSWVGKIVLTKEAGEVSRNESSGPLNRVVYIVLAEQGDSVRVRQYGVEGWVPKADLVTLDDALAYFGERIRNNPSDDRAWAMRATAQRWQGRLDNAIQDINEAIRLNPSTAWYNNRGLTYYKMKDQDRAIADYNEAIRLDPNNSFAYYNRANAYRSKGDFTQAKGDYQEAIRLNPRDPNPYNGLAWLLATCPRDDLRDGKKAIENATKANDLMNWLRANDWGTLAAAYAEAGQFAEARKWQQKALDDDAYAASYRDEASARLKLYEQNKPYHEK